MDVVVRMIGYIFVNMWAFCGSQVPPFPSYFSSLVVLPSCCCLVTYSSTCGLFVGVRFPPFPRIFLLLLFYLLVVAWLHIRLFVGVRSPPLPSYFSSLVTA